MKITTSIPIFLLFFATNSYGQSKKPLDFNSFDQWKSISVNDISPSGKYIYYAINSQEGDGWAELKDDKNNLLIKADRGTNTKLTDNEQFFITTIKPFYSETRQAKIKKKKTNEMPKDSLLIYDIKNKIATNLGAIKNYKLADKSKNFIAFTQELEQPLAKDSKTDTTSKNVKTHPAKPKKVSVLILKNLSTQDTVQFWSAENYYFDRNENYLVFDKKSDIKDSLKIDGLYVYDLLKNKTTKISNGRGVYKAITFDDDAKQLAFLADKTPEKNLLKDFKLYLYNFGADSAKVLVEQNDKNIPTNWYVSGDGSLSFSKSGNRLIFGLAPIPPIKDTTLVDFEHAKVDIWHWRDESLMTQQLVNVRRDLSKNYDAVYFLDKNNFIPLINEDYNRISYTETNDHQWAITSITSLESKIASQWGAGNKQDIFLVSLITGEKTLIKKDWIGQAYLSPEAKNVVFYNQENGIWINYNIDTKEEFVLNKNLAALFYDERNDVPDLPRSYGIAGWSADNNGIYLNDRYDIWYFSFDGKITKNVTKEAGRQNKIVFRAINLTKRDHRNRYNRIDAKKELFLTSFNEISKENGFYTLNLNKNQQPNRIIESKHVFKRIVADDSEKSFILSKENYQESANIFLTKDFKTFKQYTDINPQQKDYNWGTVELIKWTTPNGHNAEGLLYKPENFDPTKKYPIISYFYETHTEGLYNYHEPAPTPSRLMIPYFVSNEYLVFSPDIKYETGYPGKAAEEYVNSGMLHLARNYNWVDSTKMGIQGQSWGGYQVAHLITRTNMYAAAWSGAPVVNMTSAYGGIRWQTGMSRQFQYEKTQSRLGATPWENRDLYIENSPLFFLDKVTTPVAIMHNDKDGAVPWYQGIEMFTALRRLQKPVWLLNYNDDEHNLMQRQNRKDIQIRQAQFFNHYLKDLPAPEWLEKGISAKNKGINWGF